VNTLPFEKQVRVIGALVEGCSIRTVERMTEIHRDTIMRLGVRVGEACGRLHDYLFRNLNVSTIELDEQWAFIGKKQKRVRQDDPAELGDAYLFIALAANAKAVLSYVVGKRNAINPLALADDLRSRVLNRPQITADGFQPYPAAIAAAFGRNDVDFAQLEKIYHGIEGNSAEHRYSPGRIREVKETIVFGNPDPEKISTSYVERFNLTTRMAWRRFTRLTNGFSKKLENHKAAIALHVAYYNLCRVHETLRATPSMALGVTGHVWSIAELVAEALSIPPQPTPIAPEPYKGMSAGRAKGRSGYIVSPFCGSSPERRDEANILKLLVINSRWSNALQAMYSAMVED
jgi:IS1 family transposase